MFQLSVCLSVRVLEQWIQLEGKVSVSVSGSVKLSLQMKTSLIVNEVPLVA